jgi:hypothetical protein
MAHVTGSGIIVWGDTGPGTSTVAPSAVLVSGVSPVSICSNALVLIGADPIASLDDATDAARVASRFYPATRDELLRAHNWNFAQTRASLAELATGPAWGYDHAYQLPTDPYCLIVLETSLDHEAWRIEGRQLVTDATAVDILYVGRVDESGYDSMFTQALTDKLAFLFCYPLTRNASLADVLFKKADDSFRRAKSRDGQEGRLLRTLTSDRLTRVR